MPRITPLLWRTNEFPSYARMLSAHWREDLAAVARRQPGWSAGYRDWHLLVRPQYWQRSSGEWLILYGDPALLLTPGCSTLTPAVERAEHAIIGQLRLPKGDATRLHLVDELRACVLLLAGLSQLDQLTRRNEQLPAQALNAAAGVSGSHSWLRSASIAAEREARLPGPVPRRQQQLIGRMVAGRLNLQRRHSPNFFGAEGGAAAAGTAAAGARSAHGGGPLEALR